MGRTPREDSVNSEGVTKENIPSKCRPITHLPHMWRLFIGMMSGKKYTVFLDDRNLLREEQKGHRKKARGTHDLLFIDKMVVRHTIEIWQ